MTSDHDHGSRDCREIFARLSEYVDAELAAEARARVEGHLDDCSPCQAFVESLRATIRLVEKVESPILPDEARRRFVEAYERLRDAD